MKSYITAHYHVCNRSYCALKGGVLELFHDKGRISLYAIYVRATNVVVLLAKRKPQSKC